MCVHIILSSVKVVEWPPFWNELPSRLAICSLCIVFICCFNYFASCFNDRMLFLIVPVPGQ